MRTIFIAVILAVIVSSAVAQTAEKPTLKASDTWTYKDTIEKKTGWHQTRNEYTVIRATSTGVFVSIKESGSSAPPKEMLLGPDWSRFRNVNGREEVVNRPFSFPLSPGKTWEIGYTEDHPNRQHDKEHIHVKYTVAGWEQVSVPAGTFMAIRVEGEGQWSADLTPSVSARAGTQADSSGSIAVARTDKTRAQTVTGRLYRAFWYVPSVKRFVKAEEEYFAANGIRSERFSNELESFKVTD